MSGNKSNPDIHVQSRSLYTDSFQLEDVPFMPHLSGPPPALSQPSEHASSFSYESPQYRDLEPPIYPETGRFRGARRQQRLFRPLRKATDPTSYAIPVEYRKINSDEATAREYRRPRQRVRILLYTVSRFFLTAVLCAMCALVLKTYQKQGDLSNIDSQWFNTFMTALPLLVGLNYRSSLQSYARILRWWILARWDWKLREFDLILDAATGGAILRLLWASRRRVRGYIPTATQIVCVLWLLLNITGAVAIALLSLTYGVGQSEGILTQPGNITILDVTNETNYQMNAHYYGTSSTPTLLFPNYVLVGRSEYAGLNGTAHPEKSNSCRDCPSWNYTFLDRDPASKITTLSERHISATADCQSFQITNYTSSSVRYFNQSINSGRIHTLDIPWTNKPWSANNTFYNIELSTVFVVDTSSNQSCGDRCTRIYVITAPWYRRPPSLVYECTNTVSKIVGNNPYAQLSDTSARAIAGSIASFRNSTNGDWTHSIQYDWSNSWSIRPATKEQVGQSDPLYVASTIAQFTLTVLAESDDMRNPVKYYPDEIPFPRALRKEVFGKKPYRALKLSVDWPYALAIICAVPALQLIVLLIIFFCANDIVVKEESHLCTARLLAPIVQRLGDRGSLLQVEEVVEALGAEAVRLRYGWHNGGDAMRVGVYECDTEPLGGRARKFPEGKYD